MTLTPSTLTSGSMVRRLSSSPSPFKPRRFLLPVAAAQIMFTLAGTVVKQDGVVVNVVVTVDEKLK